MDLKNNIFHEKKRMKKSLIKSKKISLKSISELHTNNKKTITAPQNPASEEQPQKLEKQSLSDNDILLPDKKFMVPTEPQEKKDYESRSLKSLLFNLFFN